MCGAPMFAFAPLAATTIVESIVHVQQSQKVSFLNLVMMVEMVVILKVQLIHIYIILICLILIFCTSNFLLAIFALSAWPGLYTNTFST